MALIFVAATLVAGVLLHVIFSAQASAQIERQSQFFMDSMLAVREYTSRQVNPIVAPLNDQGTEFRPEAVPSYAATSVFSYLRSNPAYQSFSYREATLNPTNLKDKADGEETQIVEAFKADPSLKVLSGNRTMALGTFHYVAKPIRITKASCLVCHSTPERAPKSQLLTYGNSNGFGWGLDEIVGAQIVTVPIEEIENARHQSLVITSGLIIVAFTLVGLVTNAVLKRLILRPMRAMSLKADEASVTPGTVEFGERRRADEIGLLARSFERMKQSLVISMQMLKDRQP
ncbi:DUF3365 domain-containing protein [Cyanobium sp. Morenito 9A2]|uniref:c-type heme family protein n=1 Tax=Cyanobium sp. Morenito 9A2 TaxID=2823718 RepID=UPI0020CCAEED|nr:DUF3365 domain-containing protein [Cyanobium sp. Morenito 9A2]